MDDRTPQQGGPEQTIDVGALIDGNGIGPAQWTIVGLCALVALLDGLDLQSIGLAAPLMAAQLHVAPPVFAFVFSAALAGLALGAATLGPAADRVGRKGVLLASTVCFGVFTLLTAYADSLTSLLIVRFLAGFGLGGAMPSFISLASEYIPARHRAAVVSLLWAGFPLGGVVGGLLASRLIPAYGWPSVFLIGGIAPLLVAAVLAWRLPESVAFLINRRRDDARVGPLLRRLYPRAALPPQARFVLRREASADVAIGQLFREGRAPGTALLWVSFFFAFMVLVTNSSWSPILLRNEGMAIADAAIALAAYNFGSLFGSAAAGVLITRFGANLVLPVSLLGGGVAFALIGWCAPSVAAVTVAQAVFGLLLGCGSSGLIALAAIFYPSAVRSTGVGCATAIGRFGSFSGPLAVGALVAAHWPITAIFQAVAAAAVLGAAACAAMRWVDAPPPQPLGAKALATPPPPR